MSPTSTARHRRTGRKLVVSAAALAVCLLPTACDFGGVPSAPSGGSGGGYGAPAPGGGQTGGGTVVVPVGNQQPGGGNGGGYGGGNNGGGGNNNGGGGNNNGGNNGGEEEQPPAEGEQPPAEGEQPPAEGEQPPAEGEQPPAEGGEGEQPPAEGGEGEQPPVEGGEGEQPPAEEEPPAEEQPPPNNTNGLDVLGQSCADSDLPPHTGFQSSDAQCVNTSMGEVAPEDRLPSLLITDAPDAVGVGEGFQLQVATRNLVRDRFLGAAAGGYYLESSFLQEGSNLQRGHFHTACRFLGSTDEAPDSSPAPAFFLATQDNGGGQGSDTVTIDVPGANINKAGTLQCTSWAGDGSHRTPMMSRANQTPAIDSIRIDVGGAGAGQNDADNAAGDDAAGDNAQGDNAQGDNAGDAAEGDEAGAGDGAAAGGDAAGDAAAGDAAEGDAAAGDEAAAGGQGGGAANGG